MTSLDSDLDAWKARRNQPAFAILNVLDAGQRSWIERFWAGEGHAYWGHGRQRGKTVAALAMALDLMHRKPGSIVRYCALTKDSAWGIVRPAMELLLEKVPDAERPRRDPVSGDYVLKGSRLIVFGTDSESFRRGRGPRTNLQVLDEAGFYQDLERVEAALFPSLLTTGGKALYVTTPPESLAHPSVQRANAARASGRFELETMWQNPRINPERVIADESARLGLTREQLLASTYFRREYLGEFVAEESRAAMPAWNAALHAEVVGDWVRPQHFDAYEAWDWGGYTADPHFVLFSYHDFATNSLTFEDELELRGVTTQQLSEAVKAKEKELWGVNRWEGTLLGAGEFERVTKPLPDFLKPAVSQSAPRQPYLRVTDWDEQLQGDLMRMYGVAVLPTEKKEKALWADETNNLLRLKRIRIHRRCVRLIEQLYSTVWNKLRTEWERTAKDHGDAIDDLLYTVRNVRWTRDCRPVVDTYLKPPSSTQHPMAALVVPQRRRIWR